MCKVDPSWGYDVVVDFVEKGSRARPLIFSLFISVPFEYIISSLDSYGAFSLRSLFSLR